MSRQEREHDNLIWAAKPELPRGWPKPRRDYEDYMDLQAAKRVARRLTPEMLAELQDEELVVVPARMVKKAA